MKNAIMCPNCKAEIKISEVMSAQLSEKIRADIEAELLPERKALEQQAKEIKGQQTRLDKDRKAAEEQVRLRVEAMREKVVEQARNQVKNDVAVELRDRDERLKELKGKLEEANNRELNWRKKEREISVQGADPEPPMLKHRKTLSCESLTCSDS